MEQIAQQFPEAVSVQGAHGGDGARFFMEVQPTAPQPFQNHVGTGPEGHKPDGPVRVDDDEVLGAMDRDEPELHGRGMKSVAGVRRREVMFRMSDRM